MGGMMPGQAGMGSPGTASPLESASGICHSDHPHLRWHNLARGWGQRGGGGVGLLARGVTDRGRAQADPEFCWINCVKVLASGKTVSIDARWLVLSSDDLELLTPPDPQGKAPGR